MENGSIRIKLPSSLARYSLQNTRVAVRGCPESRADAEPWLCQNKNKNRSGEDGDGGENLTPALREDDWRRSCAF